MVAMSTEDTPPNRGLFAVIAPVWSEHARGVADHYADALAAAGGDPFLAWGATYEDVCRRYSDLDRSQLLVLVTAMAAAQAAGVPEAAA